MIEEPLNIAKEDLAVLDAEELSIPVVILSKDNTQEEIEEACARLIEGTRVLGFDTETKPAFKKGQSYKVSLLQLSSSDLVVLVRLSSKMDQKLLAPVAKLLKSKRIAKVGVAIHDDIKGLYKDYGLIANKMLDLRTLAKASGIGALSLTRIYAVLFGKRISKGQRLSDWEREELSPAQIDYAALDAYAGFRIFKALEKNAKREMYMHFEVPKKKSPARKKR